MPKNIFISWSGPRAKIVALALREWLPLVVNSVDPFMSEVDIGDGGRWFSAIERELASASFGIAVLTPENRRAPWLMFEIGALAKTVTGPGGEPKPGLVCPYCVGGMTRDDIEGPAKGLQAQNGDEEGTLHLVASLARTFGEDLQRVERRAARFWPDLEATLTSIGDRAPEEPVKLAPDDALAQILGMVQVLTNQVAELDAHRRLPTADGWASLINAAVASQDSGARIANLAAAAGGKSAFSPDVMRLVINQRKHSFSDDVLKRLRESEENDRATELALEKIARGDID